MNTLDAICAGIQAYRSGGPAAVAPVVVAMTDAERLNFDGLLLSTRDPLVWRTGSVAFRFGHKVARMVKPDATIPDCDKDGDETARAYVTLTTGV